MSLAVLGSTLEILSYVTWGDKIHHPSYMYVIVGCLYHALFATFSASLIHAHTMA